MAWTSPDSWATKLFSGDPWVILLAFVVALSLPILLHLYFYTTSARTTLTPTILLLGPSGSGKTSLLSIVSEQTSYFYNYLLG
jgi:signal recognition particle receptor subunit beta